MSLTASRVTRIPDLAEQHILRDLADGSETATAIETAVLVSKPLNQAYWHTGTVAPRVLDVWLEVTDLAPGNSYTFSILADAQNPVGSGAVTVLSQEINAIGVYRLALDIETVAALMGGAASDIYLASKITITGASGPSITYGARVS